MIEHFGPIKKARLNNIQDFIILVGESGSGKSTILKVLSMCRWIYKQQNIRSYLHNAGISRSPFSHNVNSYLNSSGILDYVKAGSNIVFERDGVLITIIGKDKRSASMTVTEPDVQDLCLEKVCFISEKRNTLPDLLANRSSEKYVGYYVSKLFNTFKQAQQKIEEMNLATADVKIRLVKNNGNQTWMLENSMQIEDPFSIKLEDASSGIQSAVPLEMILNYFTKHFDLNAAMNNAILSFLAGSDALKDFRPAINIGEVRHKCIDLLIEEPEMCLFPENQFRLIKQLIRSTLIEQHECIIRTAITTHSPYLLNVLNLLFLAYDKKIQVDGAWLDYDKTDVYAVTNGELVDIKVKNAHLVNPDYLSAPLDNIYNQYERIEEVNI